MTESKLLRIGQLAKLTEKTARALHLYEEMELLCPVQRSKGGFRLYDVENVARIRYIDRLQRLGYSLGDIRDLVREWRCTSSPRDAMASMEAVYRTRLAEVRRTMTELRALEDELVASLSFLAGCESCGAESAPASACGTCERTEDQEADLALITGLPAH